MLDQMQIVQTKEQPTAFIHVTVPREKIQEVMGPGIQELMAALKDQGVQPSGPWFTHHLRMDPKTFDFEISMPVAKPVTAAGRVKPGVLPAARVARTVYHGPYEGLGEAWGDFIDQIESAGHKPAENLWECYLAGPESGDDPAQWRTELNRPLVS